MTDGRLCKARLVFWSICLLFGQVRGQDSTVKVQLFGDVNLGRAVGQELLRGNLDYPFAFVRDTLRRADVVFVNLESQLTEQKGETQHPKYNLIFCGPPIGAKVLGEANVTVVSTANNHAYDYGRRALEETIQFLDSAGVGYVGTSRDSVSESLPAIVERAGIRIGFLAYTQFMNFRAPWGGRVALFEENRVRRDIESLRGQVDFLIVSYHGGAEYVDRPPKAVKRDFRMIAEAGADMVVGHHPHYVQGIEWHNKTLLAYSLGNFVFFQPQLELTQMGLGIELGLVRRDSSFVLDFARLIPARAGLQPHFALSAEEKSMFFGRLTRLSSAQIDQKNGEWFIQMRNHDEEIR